jgi:hypothetical protein
MMVTTGGRGFHLAGIVLDIEDAFFDVGFRDALDGVAEFTGDQLGQYRRR